MLVEALQRLESQFPRAESLRRSLRPGLEPAQIDRKARELPFALPEEVRTLYAWCDGAESSAPDFVYGYSFLPLDRAIELYRAQRRLARQVAGGEADELWSPRWLPLFEMDGQQSMVIVGGDGAGMEAPLYELFIQDATPLERFPSIAALVDHVAACIERGGYSYDGGRLAEDRNLVAAVRREREGDRVAAILSRLRSHPSPEELPRLERDLDDLRDPRFVDELLRLLDPSESSFELQVAVAKAVGSLEDRRAVEPLLARLPGAHPRLAEAIVSSLLRIGDRRAEEPIREILLTTRNDELKQIAIMALGALGGDESLALLEGMLAGELSIIERTKVLMALQRRGVGDYAPPGPADFAAGGALRAQLEREIAEERDPLVRELRGRSLHFMDRYANRVSLVARAQLLGRWLFWRLFQRRR